MPVGLVSNCVAVFVGGILGTCLRKHLKDDMKKILTLMFGLCAIANGIISVIRVSRMPPVILTIILGACVGQLLSLEKNITRGFGFLLSKIPFDKTSLDMDKYLTLIVIFCVSGFGMYGVFMEGIHADSSWLLSKSIVDFFTALIFASTLGFAVSIIAFPQAIVMVSFFFLAKAIAPYIGEAQIMNFMAIGGILTIAAGSRVAEIKHFPIGNMIPALFLIFPVTALWDKIFP